MSDRVNIGEAKVRLSQLVTRAEAGEEIIIARKPNRLRGRVRVRREFDDPLPDNLFGSGAIAK